MNRTKALRTFVSGVFLLAVSFSSAFSQDGAWQIVKVGDRDYLSVENVANFYRLQGGFRLVDRRLIAGDERRSVEFGANPREIYVNGVKQWLSFPVINQNGQTLVSRFDLAKTIEPCLRPAMISNLGPFHTVVIDAGHGGNDKGASSSVGYEKNYTLDVIQDLKKALESKGLRVILTRGADSYISLEERAALANDTSDAIFVSIHFNSETRGSSAHGFEVYAMTPRGAASTGDNMVTADQFTAMPGNMHDDASLALATSVQHSLLGNIPQEDRGVKRARFAVLKLNRAPAILIEGGFLTNASESKQINDPAWRQNLAEAIAQGVRSFQDLVDKRQPLKLLADYRSERLPLAGTIVNPVSVAANAAVANSLLMPVSNPSLSAAGKTTADNASAAPEPR